MPSKTEEYLALAQRTANGLTRYWESWTAYLTTASRLYKYPFADQLMIYAQRPDATACADYDVWNSRMNRYVRRGAKGIALLDESSGFPRLHYVFDVSDTGVRRNSRDPEVWQLGPDLVQPVSEMLNKTYGISGERVSQQLADVAGKLVADYWDNNGGDIRAIVDGSLLMDYDEAGVEMQFKSAAAISVTYTLLERCGFEPAGWFDKDDFRAIHEFSTPDAVYALGAAVSDMSREVLRNIERTVKTTIRRRNAERSQYEYEQQERDLLDRRGLPAPEPDPEPAPEAAGQVRQAAPDVSEGPSPGAVQHDAPERELVPAPDGGGADGREPDAADHGAVAETDPGPGQGAESAGVGTTHEQPESAGRGTGADGTDLQLSFFDAHIPTEAQQIETIDRAKSEKTPSAFVLSQAEIENELRKHGSGFMGGKQRIMALYQTQPDRTLRAKALAKEYGIGGHSHDFLDGSRGFVNHDGRGMEFDHYPEHKKFTLSWTQVERYIDLMIQSDRYLTDKEKEHYTPPVPVNAEPDATLTHAKNLIREFCQEEYDSEPDFSDLSKIGIAYTNATDEEIPIQVNVDLVEYRVERYLGEVLIDERQYESLEDLTETELEALDFSELVSVTDEELEHYHSKVEERPALLPLDAATEYNALKEQHPDALVGFEQNGQFEFYGEDARKVCELLGGKLLEKETELGTVPVTGFPSDQWAYRAKQLWQCGENVYLAGLNEDGTHHQTKYLRREDYLPLGATIHMEGRTFRVDTVNFDKDSVTLQDVALAEMRMPIFREEPLALVRELYEEQDTMESLLPDYKVGDNVIVDLPSRTIEGKIGYVGETDVRIDTSAQGQSWDNEVINKQQFEDGLRRNEPNATRPVRTEKTVAVYPAKENNLPFDIVIQTISTEPPTVEAEHSAPEPAGNFRITDDHLGEGGAKQKYARNIEAIRTLFQLEQEHRGATAEEQQVLSQYVGWGGLADAFDPGKDSWAKEYAELKGLLSEDEYAAARASTLNAHYTSPTVIRGIYDAVERMGFRSGNILEPSMGVGNFFGMLPETMQDSRLYGVELDSITGRIAKKLYPQADITVAGFETTDRRDFYDLAVGNVPFRNYRPKPARREYIEKSNGKKRPLGIPTVLDRIIQECVRIIIEPICEARFYPQSYGFRPYRAQKHAIRGIINVINAGCKSPDQPVWAIEGDIKGCFDNINHRLLLQKLWKIGIHDKRVLKIISQMLKAGYMENDLFHATELGTPQGGILSPLLSNVYLNDFDWYVGRMYMEPHRQCKHKGNDTRRLKWAGVTPKYNYRYADDWVILTSTEKEALRLKRVLTKYFRNRMKLELSQEKTYVTDLRTNGIHFLGFVVKAERKRKTPDPATWTKHLVGKPLPDMERLGKKIKKLLEEVHRIELCQKVNVQAAQIQYVNSVIMGMAQYLQTSICSHAYHAIDRRVNNAALTVWKKLYPKRYNSMQVPLKVLCNLPDRHKGYDSKTFAVWVEGKWFGITYAFITHSHYEPKPFDQKMTPYTVEGRRRYVSYRAKHKPLPCDRPSVNSPNDIAMSAYAKGRMNFEYYMNREYAYSRDKGKCKCCGNAFSPVLQKHCHHVKNKLPLDRINKVPNLVWLCEPCHRMVHNSPIPPELDAKTVGKIMKYREKLKL